MEAGMSISSISSPHFTNCTKIHENHSFLRASSFISSSRAGIIGQDTNFTYKKKSRKESMVVEAKGKKGMQQRQFQRPPPPALPKLEDDGNPKFVIFIRTSNVSLWYPLSVITGGTTAKIMVAAKDNFLGKYIYKDTITRNIAAVIYRDEKEIQKSAIRQYRVLRSATSFRYGYKLVENNNVRAALTSTDVIELPPQEELKTVLDKVKDFFGGAKESFGKLTDLNLVPEEESESKSEYVAQLTKCLHVEYKSKGTVVQSQFPMLVGTKTIHESRKQEWFSSSIAPTKSYVKGSVDWMGHDKECVPYTYPIFFRRLC